MAACNPGAKYDEDASDYTICPWSTETGHCVFLDPVPITDIKGTQIRVHSDFTQDAITSCEKATSHTVPFFSLQFTEFGHPMYEGLFPACTNAAVLLKKQVEKLPLLDDHNKEVDETSADVVNARCESLQGRRAARTDTVLYWSKEWHKDKLVEERSQPEINKHTLLITKCLGSSKQFKTFYQVR